MSLAPGTRFGSYEVAAQIGVGGMGEVHRARDLKLNREVALKVLPDFFVNDPDRLARFQREAHVLASLNHPNIAAIYGVEESRDVRALVMELVEGPTLAERIAEGPIPIDEATGIAAQIAEALGAAHDQGVVHRDLKPANIKVKPDGTVKVLDFGLAKAVGPAEAGHYSGSVRLQADLSASPTITTPAMTQIGVLLGTAAYMSPEQAKGRPADKRSDVWAFGCVFYEMLTGQRAFAEEDISETLAAVLKSEPDWTRIPSDVPQAIRTLIQRCLVKDRRLRVADISAAKFVLCELGNLGTRPATATVAAAPRSRWQRVLPPLTAAAVTAAIVGAGMWMLRPVPRAPLAAQFSFALPEGQVLSGGARQSVAISPDGTRIVYAANSRLFLRAIGELVAHPIPGTEGTTVGAVNPLFSPDGHSIAFFSMGDASPSSSQLRRVPIGGGAASPIATVAAPFGGSWGPDGIVIGQGPGGIVRVSERGGAPELLVRVRDGESAYGPQMLPDGQTVLFTLGKNLIEDGWDKAQIVAHSLKDGSRRVVVDGGADARYLQSGHLLYTVTGTVFAAPLDLETLSLTGPAVPVVMGVRRGGSGRLTAVTQLALSDAGTLVYQPGPATGSSALRNVVLEATPLKLRSADYVHPRVSPDGRVLAVGQNTGRESDIWIYDLSEQSEIRRLTYGGNNRFPVWSGDGRRVTFQSGRDGDRAIFWQSANGASGAERLTKPAQGEEHIPESWSRDGKRLLFSVFKDAKFSLWVWTLDGRSSAPFGNVLSNSPLSATFSPDGRWIAYAATDVGIMSPNRGIFVQPFPATGEQHQAPKRVIDFHPLWAPDGKSIFYVPGAARATVSVPITTRPAVAFGTPVELSRAPRPQLLAPDVRGYDVLPDGRFISVVPTTEDGSAPMTEFRVILNWFEELKRLAPVK
jgi:eukaryotic-like serine/threonine-protein kinase